MISEQLALAVSARSTASTCPRSLRTRLINLFCSRSVWSCDSALASPDFGRGDFGVVVLCMVLFLTLNRAGAETVTVATIPLWSGTLTTYWTGYISHTA